MSSSNRECRRGALEGPLSVRRSLLGAAILALAALSAAPARAQKITEVVADHAGPDVYEYIEIAANPASVVPPGVSDTVTVNLSSYRIVELDGSPDGGGSPGKILHVFQPGVTNGSGLWSTGFLTSTLERPVFTILLVSGFTGAVGDDLDAGDDGILDATPWTAVADGVAFSDGSAAARTYAAPVLGPGFGGVSAPAGGASRFPYYTDTESVADWKRNDFDGEGIAGLTGNLEPGEARNTPGGVTRVALADFYAGVDDSTQSSLRTSIHAALETHLRFPYTASTTDTWDILNLADQDPVSSGSILDIYRNATYTKIPGGTGVYNREHSWPNSYGFNDQEAASEYTDCHHLFASDTGYNSNRGNQPFGNCTSGCVENATLSNHGVGGGTGTYPGNSNWDNGVVYEVWNSRRGDLARAQLYMDVRYEGGTHPYTGAAEKNLVLTDNASLIQTNQPYMGFLSVLLQWHLEDPVDDDERARNDVIESFQGNRNPFVDHPEWVECVFLGTGCGAPSAPVAASNSPVCEGGAISLTASDVAGASYDWTGPGGFTSTLQNPTILNATTAMSGTYSVTATVGGVTSSPGTTDVTVNALPAAPTAGSNSPVTTGGTITLTASEIPGASYSWTGPNGFTSDLQNPTIPDAGAQHAGTYAVTATLNGCTSAEGTTVVVVDLGGTLTVVRLGSGSGTVLSAPAGISCGSTCGAEFPTAEPVTLTATPVAGSRFAGWAGAGCLGTGTCVVTIAGSTTVTATFLPATPSRFYSLTPCRVVDTRNAAGPYGGPALSAGSTRAFPLGGACNVPSDATAVSLNVTVADATAPGSLTMYPGTGPAPETNTITFVPGKNRANNVTMGLLSGELSVLDHQTTGTVNLIIDVNGYYR